jgi:hypothetical protein
VRPDTIARWGGGGAHRQTGWSGSNGGGAWGTHPQRPVQADLPQCYAAVVPGGGKHATRALAERQCAQRLFGRLAAVWGATSQSPSHAVTQSRSHTVKWSRRYSFMQSSRVMQSHIHAYAVRQAQAGSQAASERRTLHKHCGPSIACSHSQSKSPSHAWIKLLPSLPTRDTKGTPSQRLHGAHSAATNAAGSRNGHNPQTAHDPIACLTSRPATTDITTHAHEIHASD